MPRPARPNPHPPLFRRAALAAATALALFVSGCAASGPARPAPAGRTDRSSHASVGDASYYAARFDGRPTASGERFDNRKLTAAHRTLAFGTKVRVTNLTNGRSVVVRVNDRGPFVRGRIIDLSRSAAGRIDMVRAGVVRVRVEPIAPPPGRARRPHRATMGKET